jgi:hypothetical protein
MRFLADENVKGQLLKQLHNNLPDIDLVRVQDTVVCKLKTLKCDMSRCDEP